MLIVTWVKKLLSDWNDPIFIYLQNFRLKTLLWLTIWLNALCHCDQLPWVQLANTTVVVWHSTCKFSESVILPILVTWKESCYLLWELSSRIYKVTMLGQHSLHFLVQDLKYKSSALYNTGPFRYENVYFLQWIH